MSDKFASSGRAIASRGTSPCVINCGGRCARCAMARLCFTSARDVPDDGDDYFLLFVPSASSFLRCSTALMFFGFNSRERLKFLIARALSPIAS
jgi:hypothetical protein